LACINIKRKWVLGDSTRLGETSGLSFSPAFWVDQSATLPYHDFPVKDMKNFELKVVFLNMDVTEPVSVGYALSTEILYQMLMISFQGVLMFKFL